MLCTITSPQWVCMISVENRIPLPAQSHRSVKNHKSETKSMDVYSKGHIRAGRQYFLHVIIRRIRTCDHSSESQMIFILVAPKVQLNISLFLHGVFTLIALGNGKTNNLFILIQINFFHANSV